MRTEREYFVSTDPADVKLSPDLFAEELQSIREPIIPKARAGADTALLSADQ
jgi:hypothetical protein